MSVPSPVFYGRLLEYEAEEAFLPSEGQGWGSIFSETITLFCPSFSLYPAFAFWASHLSFLLSGWTSPSVFLFVMSCFASPGKIGMLEWSYVSANGVFWQISYGTVSELCPCTAGSIVQLTVVHSAVCSPEFFGKWCADGGRVWKVSLRCAKKLQCVRILRGLSPKLAFNRHTLESENIISILDPIYIWSTELFDNKAFDTEILSLLEMVQESLAGKARAVDWFFSSCCW